MIPQLCILIKLFLVLIFFLNIIIAFLLYFFTLISIKKDNLFWRLLYSLTNLIDFLKNKRKLYKTKKHFQQALYILYTKYSKGKCPP